MKHVSFAGGRFRSSALAYGCWRLLGSEGASPAANARAQAEKTLDAAVDSGFTAFDHADIYAGGEAERVFGNWLKDRPGLRQRLQVVTKCGIRKPAGKSPYHYDSSGKHIERSCEDSLKRLRVETIDLYLLHRPDFLTDPVEVAEAFSALAHSGKARFFGASNFPPDMVSMLQRACPMKLWVNQVEISLWKTNALQDGTLSQCMERQIVPMAWSPLGGGRVFRTRKIPGETPSEANLARGLKKLARDLEATPAQVALAWLLRHPAGIIPVVGSTDPGRIREAARSVNLHLSRPDWYRLAEAVWGRRLP